MSDIRLVQGLLITICLSLVVGIAFTLAEWGQTDTSVIAKLGPITSAPAPAPSGGGAAPPTPAAKMSAVDMAPQGTWGVVVLDIPKILSVPAIRQKVASSFPPGLNPGWFGKATLFGTPPAATGAPGGIPGGVGVITLASGAGPKLEAWLKSKGTPVTVGGATAYKVSTASAPSPGAGPKPGPAGPPQNMLISVVNDTTALAAEDQQSLAALLSASKSGGGVSPELKQFLGQYSGASIYGAALPTPAMMKDVSGGSGPSAGLKGGAFKLDLGATYDARATVRFATADAAQKAVADLKSGIAKMQQQAKADPQTAQQMKPLLDLLAKTTMSASGTDATFGAKATPQEFQGAIQTVVMIAMMRAMASHGAMMGPSGGAMPPAPAHQ